MPSVVAITASNEMPQIRQEKIEEKLKDLNAWKIKV